MTAAEPGAGSLGSLWCVPRPRWDDQMRRTQRSVERATSAEQWHQHSFGISGVRFNPCQAHRHLSQQNRPISDVRTESARNLRADCLFYFARL